MVAKSRKVETRQKSSVVVSQSVPDYIKKQNRGSESVELEDLVIPRIEIVQALSPCLKKSDPGHIPGAMPGLLFNTVTRELYGPKTTIVPVLFKKQFLIWRDRLEGGGLNGIFDNEAEANAALSDVDKPEQCEVTPTALHYVLVVKDANGHTEEAVISMAKTKLKVSRQLNSLVRMNGGDRFSRAYELSGVEASNDKGDFYNFAVRLLGFPSEDVYLRAEQMYESVTAGDRVLRADYSDEEPIDTAEY